MYVTGNLVVRSSHGNRRLVRSLIYVLINILNRLDRGVYFDVNMRAELLKEVRVIRDDLAVITNDFRVEGTWSLDYKGFLVIPAIVFRVAILIDYGSVRKRLWEPL